MTQIITTKSICCRAENMCYLMYKHTYVSASTFICQKEKTIQREHLTPAGDRL